MDEVKGCLACLEVDLKGLLLFNRSNPTMAKQVTIVAGDVTDEVVEWLRAHGVEIEGLGLGIFMFKNRAH